MRDIIDRIKLLEYQNNQDVTFGLYGPEIAERSKKIKELTQTLTQQQRKEG